MSPSHETVLVTIAYSHFCEKARWALDRAGLAYHEEAHVPGFHIPRVKMLGGRATSVPVLRTPSERFFDSTDILHWVDRKLRDDAKLFPTDEGLRAGVVELEELFDRKLGPAARRFAYAHLLKMAALSTRIFETGGPRLSERLAVRVLSPLLRRLIHKRYRTDDDGAAKSVVVLRALFADASSRLADGRPYLTGERFTAADLTFAALAVPVILPDGMIWEGAPKQDELPAALVGFVEELRESEAGKFVQRMYADERQRVVA